jgi:hypothetical protein
MFDTRNVIKSDVEMKNFDILLVSVTSKLTTRRMN